MKLGRFTLALGAFGLLVAGCSSSDGDSQPAPSSAPQSSAAAATEKPGLVQFFDTDAGKQGIAGVTFATGTYRPTGTSCTYIVRDRFNGEVITGATVVGQVDVQLTKLGASIEGSSSCGTWARLNLGIG